MSAGAGDEEAGGFASPACLLHEVDPSYSGLSGPGGVPGGLAAWRRAERERLLAVRLALALEARAGMSAAIGNGLEAILADVPRPAAAIIGAYWPFRGEPDLRPWLLARIGHGFQVALPVVAAKREPLEFRLWIPGAPLARGVWNIPIPAAGARVVPDIVIAPLVGFDAAGYRLGYGGGFYDRTLAALHPRPLAIGVGFAAGELRTIHPQPYDVPMNWIVTERETRSGVPVVP